jgi:hypothetical protein
MTGTDRCTLGCAPAAPLSAASGTCHLEKQDDNAASHSAMQKHGGQMQRMWAGNLESSKLQWNFVLGVERVLHVCAKHFALRQKRGLQGTLEMRADTHVQNVAIVSRGRTRDAGLPTALMASL